MMRRARGADGRMERMPTRVSARVSAITESATLAVDAKAKALKAAGKPVIGFGAGEPDFPTPGYIVEAAVAGRRPPARPSPARGAGERVSRRRDCTGEAPVPACRQPAMHRYTPAGGLPA